MAMVDVVLSRPVAQVGRLGPKVSSHLALHVLHSSPIVNLWLLFPVILAFMKALQNEFIKHNRDDFPL